MTLSDAQRTGLEAPGAFQLRVVSGLCGYPRGKSAMVAYGAGDDARAALLALLASPVGARAEARGPLWCRFAAAPSGAAATAEIQRLRQRFIDQFGGPPCAEEPTP